MLTSLTVACGTSNETSESWILPSGVTNTTPTANAVETLSSVPSGMASQTATLGTAPSTAASAATTNPTTGVETTPDPILQALPVTQARLLTRLEYQNTVAALLKIDASTLVLPEDTAIAGFGSVGAKEVTVNEVAAEAYEKASQNLAIEVFSDAERWPAIVGCQPQADLSDACVETYLRDFGRRTFRRPLTEEEVTQWVALARSAATSGEEPRAELGLAAVTAGVLQSPNFLYRVESATPDVASGRIRFDGLSMASRLAYLITGSGPDDVLLDAAIAGDLDSVEGVRQAATELLSGASEHMTEFFAELVQLDLAKKVERSEELFPTLDEELRESMVGETERWLSEVVVAPGADFREFFLSRTTFVDQRLSEFYGLQGSAQDFREVSLGAGTGRAGILGKAAFLMAHSSPDSSNPTRRGNFILKSFLCTEIPPPVGLVVSLPEPDESEGPKTTRQLFEQHAIDASCVNCHRLMDPFGFALEHFDSVGHYRENENGLSINAQATFDDDTFDGAVELAEVLSQREELTECFTENFYRYANGTEDATVDRELIAGLAAGLAQNGYVWRDMLLEFAASEAFTSLDATIGIPKAEDASTEVL